LNTKDETTDDHLRKIEEVLARLEKVGFNPLVLLK